MKKISSLLTIIALFCLPLSTIMAQPLPGGGGGGQPGGTPIGAPIGDGLLILGILAALYAGKKIYELYLENKLENKEDKPQQ